jgi:predicted transcriptional regulator
MKKSTPSLQEAVDRAQRRRSLPCAAECRLLRLRAGLTLIEVAESVGVTQPTISKYETGRQRPRGVILDKYLEALGVLRHAKPRSA